TPSFINPKMPGGKGMFSAFESSDEEDMKTVQPKKHASKDTKGALPTKDDTREVVGTRTQQEGDYEDYTSRKTKPRGGYRGRGRGEAGGRGRGEGRGRGRGRGEGRGTYRGGRGEGRGYGRGRGYGDRGGYRGGPRDTYSKFATREQVTGGAPTDKQLAAEAARNPDETPHMGYDKRSGSGYGREQKKGGYGKGNWGAPEEERKYEHMEAEDAAQLAASDEPAAVTDTPAAEDHHEEPQEEEEEEVNNLTYAEYKAQKEAEKSKLKKSEGRKPEELKVKNIQKYDKQDMAKKTITSNIKKHEAYAPGGISADVEVGFQPISDEEEQDDYERPRGRGGRGRGGRGRGRGDRGHRGDRGAPRGDRGAPRGNRGGRGRAQKFAAHDDDFPAL
ncbi:MAG: hypothetical protein MO852_16730, partial [Candidatus Devosia euplotis]|nr:hypothetical protein [Candidatus Devosia euplotis]